MKKRTLAGLLCLLWVATPLTAGIHYTSEQITRVDDKKKPLRMEVDAKVEGKDALIGFTHLDAPNPFMPVGSYMLTNDGGKTIVLVNPDKGTHMPWSVDAILQLAGGLMESMGGMFNIEITDPQVNMEDHGPAGSIHGMDVRHYTITSTYGTSVKVLGMKQRSEIETVQQLWTTKNVDDIALGVWLRNEPQPTGNEQLDKLIKGEIERSEIVGFPIRSKISTTTRQITKKGKVKNESTSVTEMNILTWETTAFPDGTFNLPANSELVPAPTLGGQQESGTSWRDRLKGRE